MACREPDSTLRSEVDELKDGLWLLLELGLLGGEVS
jgi:hypothetical protein